jgi:GH24 family phage-related lysozyme (muramidase)
MLSNDMQRYTVMADPSSSSVPVRASNPIDAHPAVQAWFQQLRQRGAPGATPTQFMLLDESGYDYPKALNAGKFPVQQSNGEYHWDDIGKTPDYYIKNTLPQGSVQQTKRFEDSGIFREYKYDDKIKQKNGTYKIIPTIGSGLNMLDKKVLRMLPPDVITGRRALTPQENDTIVLAKYKDAVMTARNLSGDAYYDMTPEQRASLVDMAYNMGEPTLKGFNRMWKAVNDRNWDKVADEMVDSDWYTQTGRRARHHESQFRQSPRVKALRKI